MIRISIKQPNSLHALLSPHVFYTFSEAAQHQLRDKAHAIQSNRSLHRTTCAVCFPAHLGICSTPRLTQHSHPSCSAQVGIRSSWLDRKAIIKRWERAEAPKGGFCLLLVNVRIPLVLLWSFLVAEGSIASLIVGRWRPRIVEIM